MFYVKFFFFIEKLRFTYILHFDGDLDFNQVENEILSNNGEIWAPFWLRSSRKYFQIFAKVLVA